MISHLHLLISCSLSNKTSKYYHAAPSLASPHNFHSSTCSICSDASDFSFDRITVRLNTLSTVSSKLRDDNMYSNMEALVRFSGRFKSSPESRVENWLVYNQKENHLSKVLGLSTPICSRKTRHQNALQDLTDPSQLQNEPKEIMMQIPNRKTYSFY